MLGLNLVEYILLKPIIVDINRRMSLCNLPNSVKIDKINRQTASPHLRTKNDSRGCHKAQADKSPANDVDLLQTWAWAKETRPRKMSSLFNVYWTIHSAI